MKTHPGTNIPIDRKNTEQNARHFEGREPVQVRRRPAPDYRVENHGTIYLFRPLNEAAGNHLRENVQEDAQWFGDALVVEHRYASDLAVALTDNGFVVA